LDLEYFELENFGFLNPTVAGIATKKVGREEEEEEEETA
jgi:hypothetical protein